MSRIILFDLPSSGRNASWSLNPWKTRLALNFKGVEYETKWLEYPDVEPTLKSFGIPPNDPSGPAAYTIPTVRFADGRYIMDSSAIATELEALHPSPSLHLDAPSTKAVEKILPDLASAARGIWMALVPPNLLNPVSQEFFVRTRKVRFGMSLEEFAREKGGEVAWEKMKAPMKQLGDLLRKEDGPFVMGATASYGDFYIVSLLHFWKRVDENIYQRAVKTEPAFGTLYEASKKWLERDDH